MLLLPGESAPRVIGKRARYPQPLATYAAIYGRSEWTVKSWIKKGKKAGDLPPLHDKTQMLGWLALHLKYSTRDDLLATLPSKPSHFPVEIPPPENHPLNGAIDAQDFETNVVALRRTHGLNQKLVDEAIATKAPEGEIALRHRNFERTLELLRKAELSLDELQARRSKFVPLAEIQAELSQTIEMLELLHKRMPGAILDAVKQRLPSRMKRFRLLEPTLRKAVEDVRGREENIFRNLTTITGRDALEAALAGPAERNQ